MATGLPLLACVSFLARGEDKTSKNQNPVQSIQAFSFNQNWVLKRHYYTHTLKMDSQTTGRER